ncbi:hypothetical protein PHYBOEH_000294 [Phytophthora boehmeriae]|uniref:Ubiquitin-like domain-containing protein n=1 Tax=Phytophthora boehmeriae TaxID=109152 RepID=A0A8T1VBD5_9STRA|nr:hypothetical protein PHYBOEH_000294 [Phytophthora boehmeriae]
MDECHVTVSFGKQSAVLRFSPQDPQALDKLKTEISQQFQLAPQYQRLVLHGRDVKDSTVLTSLRQVMQKQQEGAAGSDTKTADDGSIEAKVKDGKGKSDDDDEEDGADLQDGKKG